MTLDNKKDVKLAMATTQILGDFECYVFGEDFVIYEERLVQHFILNDIPDNKKVAFLITHIGNQAYEVLKKLLAPIEPKNKTYEDLVKELKSYFTPEINEIPERYRFFLESQKSGQSVKEYVVELRRIASKCNFDNFLESALRDRLVFGLRDSKLRTQLLKVKKLTFKAAFDEAVAWEMAEKEGCDRSLNVNRVNQPKFVQRSRNRTNRSRSKPRFPKEGSQNVCSRCGSNSHNAQECPAKNWTCFKCNKAGHTSKMCHSKFPHP